MSKYGFNDLTGEELKTFVRDRHEKDYLLVDVRQPEEYEDGHIPGAILAPLGNLEAIIPDLPDDREIVFYCRSGNRSRYASIMGRDSGRFSRSIFNLAGGILAYDGRTLPDFPKLDVFDLGGDPAAMGKRAIGLEKGAGRFYRAAASLLADYGLDTPINELAAQEEGHARLVHQTLSRTVDLPPFEELYEGLAGDMVEGGLKLVDLMERLHSLEGGFCLNFFELALNMELAAYDLYRNLAEFITIDKAKDTFLAIAQAEKVHMAQIARAFDHCPGLGGK